MVEKLTPKQRAQKLQKAYEKFHNKILQLSKKQEKLVKDTTEKVKELKIRAIKDSIK